MTLHHNYYRENTAHYLVLYSISNDTFYFIIFWRVYTKSRTLFLFVMSADVDQSNIIHASILGLHEESVASKNEEEACNFTWDWGYSLSASMLITIVLPIWKDKSKAEFLIHSRQVGIKLILKTIVITQYKICFTNYIICRFKLKIMYL